MRLLTPELKRWIGRTLTCQAPEPLGLAAIRAFANALRDPNPLHVDQQVARATRHQDIIAPPTLIFETTQLYDTPSGKDGQSGHRWMLPGASSGSIRGANEYQMLQPARPDDLIETTWHLENILEKETRRGTMLFVVSNATYTNYHGQILGTNRETMILGGKPEFPAKVGDENLPTSELKNELRKQDTHTDDESGPGKVPPLEMEITLQAMVEYAAATWDFHRYHYDAEYVRALGFLAPFMDGQMLGGLVARQLMGWAGLEGFLRKLSIRYT